MAIVGDNSKEVYEILLKTKLDETSIKNALADFENSIDASEKRVGELRKQALRTQAGFVKTASKEEQDILKEKYSEIQGFIKAERDAINALKASYTGYEKVLESTGSKIASMREKTRADEAKAYATNVSELQKSIDEANKYMLDKDKAVVAAKKQSRADEAKAYIADLAELQKSVDQANRYMLDKDKATIEARKQARAEEVKTEEQQIAKLIALQEKVSMAHGQSMGLVQPVARSGNNIYGDYTSLTTGTTTRADAELIAKNESAARLAIIKKEYSDRASIIVGAEEARVAAAKRADQEILDNFSKVSKNIGTFGSSVLPQGAYSNLDTRATTADNSYNAFRDKERALNESAERIVQSQARAAQEVKENWDKSFMGALEHGTTFGHKLVTTMEYAIAGTAFYGMVSGFGKLTSSITDANKALTMFEVVLFSNEGTAKATKDAKDLQNEIFRIGTTYGGTVKELNESALALGRAGIEGKDLAEGIRAVNQVAMLSGDSLTNITNTMVSWKTLYPEKTMSQLADSMA
ncbi:MAG: hypothetical protein JHC33_06880, partial [Ignisphaera sp.]|nr:hypothetical protein [Ignisphaera sp.]